MKKIFLVLLGSLFLFGCEAQSDKKIDYSEYSFTDVSWVRDSGYDIETLRFNSDASFSYYCACGNPVNDSDLCESYSYDDENKEIKLDCFEITDEMVTSIKILEVSDDSLKLDFNGETRLFERKQ